MKRLNYVVLACGLVWLGAVLWLVSANVVAREISPIGTTAAVLDRLPSFVGTPLFILLWFISCLAGSCFWSSALGFYSGVGRDLTFRENSKLLLNLVLSRPRLHIAKPAAKRRNLISPGRQPWVGQKMSRVPQGRYRRTSRCDNLQSAIYNLKFKLCAT
jgi:hypothetical protein